MQSYPVGAALSYEDWRVRFAVARPCLQPRLHDSQLIPATAQILLSTVVCTNELHQTMIIVQQAKLFAVDCKHPMLLREGA